MTGSSCAVLQATESLLKSLQAKDFEGVRKSLILPARLALPAKVLSEICKQSTSITGPMESFSHVGCHTSGYFPTTKALVKFQKATFALVVRFGPRYSVVGFKLQQPISLGLPSPWITPSYVDEQTFDETPTKINPFWLFPGIEGLFTIPRTPGKKAAVLFLQGSGMGDLDASIGFQKPAKDLAWGLASSDIVVLRIGKPLLWIVYEQKIAQSITPDDEYLFSGLAALKMLANHPKVDSKRIFVAGFSMGGRYAPRLCQQSPVPIAGMISLAGPADHLASVMVAQSIYDQEHFPKDKAKFEEDVSKLQELCKRLEGGSSTENNKSLATLPYGLPLSYFLHDYEHKPTSIVKDLKMRFLVMQGLLDWQVPPENNLAAWRQALKEHEQKGEACINAYPGLSHTFVPIQSSQHGLKQYEVFGHVAENVIQDITEWVTLSP